mmetsp:Transcript_40000/g.58819  ORF Transcript_40000/g.58819 Transcript_40000/m.58819 type:complete len:163 (+) Transcript_40000:42-530(+)|eukprot:CAMPEP_0195518520 /NCGR_PEP_ID=MMETSP0794_2-20130614/13051_1 /TAXON_ID=515487 /ORGANISM="Stephanopyxis turris, Strain CCMP 815" /LENGTH=162 /DNA_ID=CAMNT_0040647499 /DNA_START=39 /DNA_END=527 /DNA_ORIENTATION=-
MIANTLIRRVPKVSAFAGVTRTKVTNASALWKGQLMTGTGSMSVGSGAFTDAEFSFPSRFENDGKTNPEELIGASQAGCYSMFLSALISDKGLTPESVSTTAQVTLGDGPAITKIVIDNVTKCDGLTEEEFQQLAADAKAGCPISKALAGVPEITLSAKLEN